MTISAKYEPIEYVGDGETTNFVPPFRFFDREIEVTINDSPTSKFDVFGGTVVFHTAPADGAVVVFKRKVPLAQEVKFIEGENFPASDFEYSLDRLYMALQELKYKIENIKKEEEDNPSGDVDGRIEALVNSVSSLYTRLGKVEESIKTIEDEFEVINNTLDEYGKRIVTRQTITADVIPEDWKKDYLFEEYPYMAEIKCDVSDKAGPTNVFATVVFDPKEADSGNFSTYADTDIIPVYDTSSMYYPYALVTKIYAKEIPTETFTIYIKLD